MRRSHISSPKTMLLVLKFVNWFLMLCDHVGGYEPPRAEARGFGSATRNAPETWTLRATGPVRAHTEAVIGPMSSRPLDLSRSRRAQRRR